VVNKIVVVVAPENALLISQLLSDCGLTERTHLVVQPQPKGPGEALYRALAVSSVYSDRVMLLMGDNYMSEATIHSALHTDPRHLMSFGIRTIQSEVTANMLARIHPDGHFVEGESGGLWADAYYRCWLGPAVFDRHSLVSALGVKLSEPQDGEIKLIPLFEYMRQRLEISMPHTFLSDAIDLGTPQWLNEERNFE
jgi:hypothetical protein